MFAIKTGDTDPPLQVILKDAAGKVAIVNGSDVVTFRMAPVTEGVGPSIDDDATVNDAPTGDVQYDWPGGAPTPGLYKAEFHLVRLDGSRTTFPGDGFIDVLVEPTALD